MKATCSKCNAPLEPNRIGRQRYCLKCHAKIMRETRPKYSELPLSEKMKMNARTYSKIYLKRGLIEKKPCEVCGSEKSEMHHEDYSNPMLVKWLCREHHLQLHY